MFSYTWCNPTNTNFDQQPADIRPNFAETIGTQKLKGEFWGSFHSPGAGHSLRIQNTNFIEEWIISSLLYFFLTR